MHYFLLISIARHIRHIPYNIYSECMGTLVQISDLLGHISGQYSGSSLFCCLKTQFCVKSPYLFKLVYCITRFFVGKKRKLSEWTHGDHTIIQIRNMCSQRSTCNPSLQNNICMFPRRNYDFLFTVIQYRDIYNS